MSTTKPLPDNGMPQINRFITGHDKDGQTIFMQTIPEPQIWQELADGARFNLAYATNKFPVDLNDDADVITYQNYLQDLPGVTIPGGSVLRLVDILPGALSPMHRTVSLDYGVVLEGEVELLLDSGESRVMKRGDIAIQRGTCHAWRNVSKISYARMLYVLQEAEPLRVGGRQLEEDYGTGIPGVKPSKTLNVNCNY